jgi:pentatricopeptide repeat protein
MTMAIQSCVARGDMETAAELMKRMEELGLEVRLFEFLSTSKIGMLK